MRAAAIRQTDTHLEGPGLSELVSLETGGDLGALPHRQAKGGIDDALLASRLYTSCLLCYLLTAGSALLP